MPRHARLDTLSKKIEEEMWRESMTRLPVPHCPGLAMSPLGYKTHCQGMLVVGRELKVTLLGCQCLGTGLEGCNELTCCR